MYCNFENKPSTKLRLLPQYCGTGAAQPDGFLGKELKLYFKRACAQRTVLLSMISLQYIKARHKFIPAG